MKRESELHLLPTSQRTQCAAIRKTCNSSVGSWITLRDSNGTGINVLGGRMLSAVDMAVTIVTTRRLNWFSYTDIAKDIIFLPFNFVLAKFGRPYKASPQGGLMKFCEGPTELVGTDDTTFTVCSVRPHDIFKFKCTAWSGYVILIPTELSWRPTAIMLFRHCLRIASLVLLRVHCEVCIKYLNWGRNLSDILLYRP